MATSPRVIGLAVGQIARQAAAKVTEARRPAATASPASGDLCREGAPLAGRRNVSAGDLP